MSREEIQKLLGGYATGTLTAEEQRALYEAALTDQELFDAMAREEALREVLSDPASRAHLLAAIEEAPEKWYQRWWRPMVVMATAAGLVVTLMLYTRGPKLPEMAKVELPKFVPPAAATSTPMLPPAPELRKAAPPLRDLPITLPAPKAISPPPPPAPARDAAAPVGGLVIDGVTPSNGPRQQQAFSQLGGASGAPGAAPAPLGPRNAMFEANSVHLDGTVTDANGVKVSGATVEVKSLTTGNTFQTTSDAKGEFKAKEPPSDQVEIKASKPGFQEAKVSQATPPAGNAQPVNLQLDAQTASQTVEVTAQSSTVRSTAGLAGGTLAARTAAPAPVLQYQLLRTVSGRRHAEVHAEDNVPAGSVLTLRVTPTADGFVRIVDGSRTIAAPAVRRGKAVEIDLGTFAQSGHVALAVYFSRQSADAKDQTAPAMTIPFNVQ